MAFTDGKKWLFRVGRPFSSTYSAVMASRYHLYQNGILKTARLPRPVLSIGNITLGGTGKTPHVIALCEALKDMGHRPAVLTRGYGGRAGKGPVVVSDGQKVKVDVDVAGDEPLMMAKRLKDVVIVAGSDRYRCGSLALKSHDISVFVLDDGFQHLRLHRDLDIVLLDAGCPLGSEKVFPGGDLRESPKALNRAHAIILTKCDEIPFNELDLVEEKIRPFVEGKPIFRTSYKIQNIKFVYVPEGADLKTRHLQKRSCFCFCAIARPQSFFLLLKREGIRLEAARSFQDHYRYSRQDIEDIGNDARKKDCELVLTTEKDFAKIPLDTWSLINDDISLAVVQINVDLPLTFVRFLETRLDNPAVGRG